MTFEEVVARVEALEAQLKVQKRRVVLATRVLNESRMWIKSVGDEWYHKDPWESARKVQLKYMERVLEELAKDVLSP